MSAQSRNALQRAREALQTPIDYNSLLAKFGAKDRLNVERHVAFCEAESDPRHAALWRRFACGLMTLAPHMPKTSGQQTIQFYVQDGKYRMQVFALEDRRDGTLVIYAENTMEQALALGLLSAKPAGDEGANLYRIGRSKETLSIETLDGKTPNPAPFFKDMLGWNRKGLRITLPVTASDAQVEAVESLCALASIKWIVSPQEAKAKGPVAASK